MKRYEYLIRDPREVPLQAFVTDRLQLGDVLEKLLQYCGSSRVIVSTYSTGEEFLRRVAQLRRSGRILHLTIIADWKAAEKTARLHGMLHRLCDELILANNHSKVMLIEGDIRVASLLSQNQTRGNRLENYTIIHDSGIWDSLNDSLSSLRKQNEYHYERNCQIGQPLTGHPAPDRMQNHEKACDGEL